MYIYFFPVSLRPDSELWSPVTGLQIKHRLTTFCRTPLDELQDRHRDLILTKHNTYNRQTAMPPAGFELVIPANELL
jgi:hypothetical protein